VTTLIVDTDVASFLLKGDTRAQLYRPYLQDKTLALSFMTIAELYQWAYARGWGNRKVTQLEEQLRRYVVVPFDNELCMQWAKIRVQRQQLGRPISVQDAWIAATALRHNCALVTHNGDDFSDIAGLEVISEG
jgi:tRNA(fMet)-specific endonuclease VapC